MAGRVLNINGMYGREALLRNHFDEFCHYPAGRSDGRVFDTTGGEGIVPLRRLGYCPHTGGSTAYNESVSG